MDHGPRFNFSPRKPNLLFAFLISVQRNGKKQPVFTRAGLDSAAALRQEENMGGPIIKSYKQVQKFYGIQEWYLLIKFYRGFLRNFKQENLLIVLSKNIMLATSFSVDIIVSAFKRFCPMVLLKRLLMSDALSINTQILISDFSLANNNRIYSVININQNNLLLLGDESQCRRNKLITEYLG